MTQEQWRFLTNHGFVLLALSRQPDLRLRDIAAMVGITERAAQDIVNQLVEAGFLERLRQGRRNRYLVHGELPLRHGLTEAHPAAHLIGALTSEVRTSPDEGVCVAVVLACSDYRFQDGVRRFLATEGLLGRAEIVLWPGGGAALVSPQRDVVLTMLKRLVNDRTPERLLLMAHQDCTAEGIFSPRRDASRTYRALVRERRDAMARLTRALGVTPELWYTDLRRTRRIVIHQRSARPAARARSADPAA